MTLLFTIGAFAQKQLPFIEYYSVASGLSSNAISCTYRDSKGYLWVGTNDGLNRFNGKEFITYNVNNSGGSQSSNFIQEIFEDDFHRIWIRTNRNVIYTLIINNTTEYSFQKVKIESEELKQKISPEFFFRGDKNSINIACKNDLILCYNVHNSKITPIHFTDTDNHKYLNGSFLFYSAPRKRVFFLNDNLGIYTFDMNSHKTKFIFNDALNNFINKNNIASKYIQKIVSGSNDQHILWLLNKEGNFVSYNIEENTCSSVCSIPQKKTEVYRAIGVDYRGFVWVSGNNGGATVCDLRNKIFTDYFEPFKQPYSINTAEVYSYYCDNENNFWILTRSGIFKMDPLLNRFENFTIRAPETKLNTILNISSFYKPNPDQLFIGAVGGMFVYNESTGSMMNKALHVDSDKTDPSIFFNASNKIYISTMGVQLLDTVKWTATDIPLTGNADDIAAFKKSSIHSLLIDTLNNQQVWWLNAWQNSSLYLYNTVTHFLERINVSPAKTANVPLRGICKDVEGRIWFGSPAYGLCCIANRNNKEVSVYSIDDSTFKQHNTIADLCMDSKGMIWMVTKNGITSADISGIKPVINFYDSPEKNLHPIKCDGLMDKHDNLWFSTSNGLHRFNTQTHLFNYYDFTSGILNPQFATGAYKDRDGNFYFSSFTTFVRFNPDEIISDTNTNNVKIDFAKFSIMENDSTPLLHSSDLKLPYDKNFLAFQLEAITMTNAAKCKFRYILKGLDNNWIDAGTRNYVAYNALQPGNYTFQFTACNADGMWNKNPKQFSFTILPPWYHTWWFYFSMAVAAAATVYSVVYFRIRRVKAKEKLKLQVMIETQEDERKRIGRDLHDDVGAQLSTLKLFLNSMKDKEGDERKTLHVESMEMLTTSIGDIRNILINLSPKTLDEHGYVAAVEEMVNRINKSNALRFELSMYGFRNRLNQKLENGLYRITQELINNTLKYAQAKKIILGVIHSSDKIRLMYEDDGKGCDLAKANTGYGLTNIQTRAQMFNGTVEFDSGVGNGFRCVVEIKVTSE